MARKRALMIIFGLLFILVPLMLVISNANVDKIGNSGGSCGCHMEDAGISINTVNSTTINVNPGQSFSLGVYASTPSADGNFTIRISTDEVISMTFTPSMMEPFTGIWDGSSFDPDSIENQEIGNVTNPAMIQVSNVPFVNDTFVLHIYALQNISKAAKKAGVLITVNVGQGGERPPTGLEWFLENQVPLIVLFSMIFIVCIVSSRVFLKRSSSETVVLQSEKKGKEEV